MRTIQGLSAAALAAGVMLSPALLAADEATDGVLFFQGDMVSEAAGCVLANQFKPGEVVVFRVAVQDASGTELTDTDLASLTANLPDGQSFDMHYGTHPPGDATDAYWTVAWLIPDDYPTGTLGYSIIATDKDGNAHQWAPFDMFPSKLTIVPG